MSLMIPWSKSPPPRGHSGNKSARKHKATQRYLKRTKKKRKSIAMKAQRTLHRKYKEI